MQTLDTNPDINFPLLQVSQNFKTIYTPYMLNVFYFTINLNNISFQFRLKDYYLQHRAFTISTFSIIRYNDVETDKLLTYQLSKSLDIK